MNKMEAVLNTDSINAIILSTKGYPQTAQKCLEGNLEGGTTAVIYDGDLDASGGCEIKCFLNYSSGFFILQKYNLPVPPLVIERSS